MDLTILYVSPDHYQITNSYWKKTGGYLTGWSTISSLHKVLNLLIYLSITVKRWNNVITVIE